ncbi:MAG: TraB/GumN family protein [Flavobacteriales bacterium]
MIQKQFILFLLILCSTLSLAQKDYPSLLWEITGDDLDDPSYLYGTMHVSSKIAFSLSDSFFVALNNVDMVALESDPSEWMDEMEEADMLNQNYRYNRDGRGNGDFYSTAFNVNIPNSKDYAEMLRYEPGIVNGLLYRFNGQQADFEEDTYLDLFIFQAGKKLKKEVVNLEDFKEVQELSEKAQKEARKEKNKINPFNYEDNPYEIIEDAYRKGDLDRLDSVMLMLNGGAYTEYMLFQRNQQMADKMDSIITSGTSLFTGIGAAHLAGEKGVIEMLRKKGFTLKPILKNFSDKSIKSREKIDKIHINLDYTYQYPSDSIFKLKLPGKLYELNTINGRQTYIHPEMIHGSNYSVLRIKTFNAMTGNTPSDVIESVDSLLFENIPGEVIKKKYITKNNHPGIDILNKTRRGDYQRYQIIALPSELVIFKLKGSRKFAKSKEANKFFESIELLQPQSAYWEKFTAPANEYTVMLPSSVSYSAATSTDGFVNLQVTDAASGDFYIIQRNVLHDNKYIEEDQFELEYLIESLAEESDLSVANMEFNPNGKYPSAAGELTTVTGKTIYAKTTLKGGKYYLLIQVSNSGVKNDEFFSSFALQREKNEEFNLYTDTTLFFKVNTIPLPDDFGVNEDYDYYFDLMEEEELDNSHLPVSDGRTFFNEATGERIVVDYYKYHKYRNEENEQEYWQKRLDTSWDYESLIRSEIDSGFVNGYPYRQFSYTDTNSIRQIHSKIILKNSTKYSIYYLSDTVSEPSEFVSEFMSSFSLLDTNYTDSFFTTKSDEYFQNIWGEDSIKMHQALTSMAEIYFEDQDAPEIIKVIDDFSHEEFTVYDKAYLIEELGFLEHKAILPYLANKYKAVEDTAAYQLAVLKALGRQRTKEASHLFKSLLIYETPLSRISEINPIFYSFKDSLELAAHLYPELLELSALDEYQKIIYELTARLKDEGIISHTLYQPKLKEIKWEARNTLKRKLASEEDASKNKYSDYLSEDYNYGAYYSRPSDYKLTFYNNRLAVYYSLLNDYRSDPRVNSFYKKLNKIKDEKQVFNINAMALVLGETLADSTLNEMCASDKTRSSLYDLTQNFDMEWNDSCMTQQSLARSILFSNSTEKDSVSFISQHKVNVKSETGYVYFFKSMNSYNEQWQISYYGLFPENEEDLKVSVNLRGNKIKLRNSSEEEKIDEIMEDFKLHNRERADKKSSGGFNDYYLYD